LPGIGNSDFTESTTQLIILGTAETAITIMAASIPILRALIRDTRPPPGPAEFYHDFNNMYTGTAGSRGTGRTSTVITSTHTSVSRASTRWSKDFFESAAKEAARGSGGPTGLLSLKRWSQMSHHRRGSSGATFMTQQQIQGTQHPPPGKILTTEEVVVEYEKTEGVWIGKAF
jgi:hypothetical protein